MSRYGEVPENVAELSVRLSQRHFGVGSDGMIFISPSDIADFSMRIFNADGSEAKMCGNGIRCVGKYVFDKGYTDKTQLRIETQSGIKQLELHTIAGKVKTVTVSMGKACVGADLCLSVDGEKIVCTPVSVGNPHAVIFVDDIASVPLTVLGEKIEHNDAFPGGTNVEFVQVLSDTELRMRVWERGSGVTLACGTGSCATTVAAVCKKICPRCTPISLILDGGTLKIQIDGYDNVTMTGPAEIVCEGDVAL